MPPAALTFPDSLPFAFLGFLFSAQSNSLSSSFPQPPFLPPPLLQVRVVVGTGWLERFGRDHFDKFSAPDFCCKVSRCPTGCLQGEPLPNWLPAR